MYSYLFQGYFRVSECKGFDWDLNSGLRLHISNRYQLLHSHIPTREESKIYVEFFLLRLSSSYCFGSKAIGRFILKAFSIFVLYVDSLSLSLFDYNVKRKKSISIRNVNLYRIIRFQSAFLLG